MFGIGIAATQEVQWRTAFWPLVSLAVLTMSQPCGGPLRPYCFACLLYGLFDSFSTTVLKIQRKQKVCKNLGSSTFDRWIFAILGPVPMMIKMASFTGTPLTNMYANSFVARFIITELIIVTTPEDLHPRNP
jgi:hypothetical protein